MVIFYSYVSLPEGICCNWINIIYIYIYIYIRIYIYTSHRASIACLSFRRFWRPMVDSGCSIWLWRCLNRHALSHPFPSPETSQFQSQYPWIPRFQDPRSLVQGKSCRKSLWTMLRVKHDETWLSCMSLATIHWSKMIKATLSEHEWIERSSIHVFLH